MKNFKYIITSFVFASLISCSFMLTGCNKGGKIWNNTFAFTNSVSVGWYIDGKSNNARDITNEHFKNIDLSSYAYLGTSSNMGTKTLDLTNKNFKNGKALYDYLVDYYINFVKDNSPAEELSFVFGSNTDLTFEVKQNDKTIYGGKLDQNLENTDIVVYNGYLLNSDQSLNKDTTILSGISEEYTSIGLYIAEYSYPLSIYLKLTNASTYSGNTIEYLQLDFCVYYSKI